MAMHNSRYISCDNYVATRGAAPVSFTFWWSTRMLRSVRHAAKSRPTLG